ncbi:hypothetical protein [Mucilaginibacter ginkgonis]|uniref:Uncharacterized protein n=1 Tax=Mucilaginibacter ginkgonis TaxID=2682091 RepID=A0A6I4HWV8_9SPHI|nr:hypothetical protein [Mucilaginibacter ginkgonis]QQL49905.1 hypothetical protein GO620_000190 [Mucilaginibacter ginkgonis]
MTLIAAIKTRQGIVMTADSKEMIQGGQLLWSDFETILQAKSLHEDFEQPAISPAELKELFRTTAQANDNGRIKSMNTGLKLFKLTEFTGLSTTGTANPGGLEFSQIIVNIQSKLKSTDLSLDEICDIAFNYFENLFETDGENRFKNNIIFCGYDWQKEIFRSFVFYYNEKRVLDCKGGFKLDVNRVPVTKRFFYKQEVNDDRPLILKGWVGCLQSLDTYNQKAPNIDLIQGFILLNKIMELGVTIEEISHVITGIGGKILYAVITKEGFRFVENEADVRNITFSFCKGNH